MTTIKITKDVLEIQIEGLDKIWALRKMLQIPLKHVLSVESYEEESRKWKSGIRILGTYFPGIISAGTFYQHGGFVFWDVHNVKNAIGIALRDERYKKLIIEVINPLLAMQEIESALHNTN